MMRKIFFLATICFLGSDAFAQLELNSNGKAGIAIVPHNSYGLRVGGNFYNSGNMYTRDIYPDDVYGDDIGRSYSDFYGRTVKFYGSVNETSWNVTLKSETAGELCLNGQLVQCSDERLKKGKKPIKDACAKLESLSGHTYYWKSNDELESLSLNGTKHFGMDTIMVDDSLVVIPEQKFAFSDKMQYGFMAQDVMKAFPDLVSYDSAMDLYAVNYIGLIPVLVEANKELMDKQSEMEQRMAKLEELVAKLAKGDKSSKGKEIEPDAEKSILETAELKQNSPNPFSDKTQIEVLLPVDVEYAELFVFNLQGQQVQRLEVRERGRASVTVRAGSLQPGMYIYTLIADGEELGTRKMILAR